MTRWITAIPLVLLLGFGGLGVVQLFDGTRPEFERVSRDAPAERFSIMGSDEQTTFAELAADGPIIVNLWASWCAPCRVEHPLLIELGRRYPDRLHGVLFDDTVENGETFLDELGNPFTTVALDLDGQIGLDFGHTGVPETFVIAPGGEVALHIRGQLVPGHLDILAAEMQD